MELFLLIVSVIAALLIIVCIMGFLNIIYDGMVWAIKLRNYGVIVVLSIIIIIFIVAIAAFVEQLMLV